MAFCINLVNGLVVVMVFGGRVLFIFRWVNDLNSDWVNGGVVIISFFEIDEFLEGNYILMVFEDCGSLVDFFFIVDGVVFLEIFVVFV